MKKIWLYRRESTQVGAELVQERFAKLKEFADKNGYEVVGQSFDLSGWRDIQRPGLRKAMEAVESNEADAILVTNFRTLGRDAQTIHKIFADIGRPDSLVSTEGEEKFILGVN